MAPPCVRKRPSGPGPWNPSDTMQDLGRSGPGGADKAFPKAGYSSLDVECKASLQKILKPSNYVAINPWMQSARTKDKRCIVSLAKASAAAEDAKTEDPAVAYAKSIQPVVQNSKGRTRLASSVQKTADRAQCDLFVNRSLADQSDKGRLQSRRHLQNFASVPSLHSVSDYYSLADRPIGSDPSTAVITEAAKRGLAVWQVRGPEESTESTAEVMGSLRSISSVVSQMSSSGRGSPSASRPQATLQHSGSAPAPSRPFYDPGEISDVSRPGGYIVRLHDKEHIAMLKNKERNKSSQLPLLGGSRDWITSYGVMADSARC